MVAAAYLAPTVQLGQIFVPMHSPKVNRLTHSAFDPHSREPNDQACAVAVEKSAGSSGKLPCRPRIGLESLAKARLMVCKKGGKSA